MGELSIGAVSDKTYEKYHPKSIVVQSTVRKSRPFSRNIILKFRIIAQISMRNSQGQYSLPLY